MKGRPRPRAAAAEPAALKAATGLGASAPASPTAAPMHRTQIYLSREEFDFVHGEATRRGEPMAAVIRALIDERMQVPAEVWEHNPLLAPPADPGFVGPEDGAINHDHYVHGTAKRWIKRRGRWVEAPPLPADYYTNPASAAAYDRKLEPGR